MWGAKMLSNYAKAGAGGLGTMMGTALGKRTLVGAGIGVAAGGYMGGFSGAITGGIMGAGAGRYGGAVYANRGLGARGAGYAGGRAFGTDIRGITQRSNRAYNSIVSSLKNWSSS